MYAVVVLLCSDVLGCAVASGGVVYGRISGNTLKLQR